MGRRGSVLAHVLVVGVLVSLVAAGLLRLSMMRHQVAVRSERMGVQRRMDDGALARLTSAWNAQGGVCTAGTALTDVGCSCTGTGACGCSCTCTAAGGSVAVQTSGTAAECALEIVSPDLMQ